MTDREDFKQYGSGEAAVVPFGTHDPAQTIAALERRNAEQAKTIIRMQGEIAALRTNIGTAIDERDALANRCSAFREWLENRSSWACTNNEEWAAAALACEALARFDGDDERAESIARTTAVRSTSTNEYDAVVQRCHALYETLAQPGPMPMTFAEIKSAIAGLTEAPPPSLASSPLMCSLESERAAALEHYRSRLDDTYAPGGGPKKRVTVILTAEQHQAAYGRAEEELRAAGCICPKGDERGLTGYKWSTLDHEKCPVHRTPPPPTEAEHLHAAQLAAREHVSPCIRMAAECCDDADARVAYHMIAAAVDGEIDPQIIRFAKALVRFVEGGPHE